MTGRLGLGAEKPNPRPLPKNGTSDHQIILKKSQRPIGANKKNIKVPKIMALSEVYPKPQIYQYFCLFKIHPILNPKFQKTKITQNIPTYKPEFLSSKNSSPQNLATLRIMGSGVPGGLEIQRQNFAKKH